MKGTLFLNMSLGCAAIVACAGVLLVALASVRTLTTVSEYYQTKSEIEKKREASNEDVISLAGETFGVVGAKLLGRFQLISSEDEKRIVSAAADRIEGKSATLRALVDAVERHSEMGRRSATGASPQGK